ENTFITIEQDLQPDHPGYVGGAALLPGNNPGRTPTSDANIVVSAAMVSNGGFASLILNAPAGTGGNNLANGFVRFAGDVSLALPDQLVINTGTIIASGGIDVLRANYIEWNNAAPGLTSGAAMPGNGSGHLSIEANNVDLVGNLAVQGAAVTNFVVASDLRLT